MAYIKVALNPMDQLSFDRVVNKPRRGVGEATLMKIREYGATQGMSTCELLQIGRDDTAHLGSILKEGIGLPSRAITGIEKFSTVVRNIRNVLEEKKLGAAIADILDIIEYKEYISTSGKEESADLQAKLFRINQLVSIASQDLSLYDKWDPEEVEPLNLSLTNTDVARRFLDHVALSSSDDQPSNDDQSNFDDTLPPVRLMTMHAAKGLEFDHVYIPSCVEGLIPHSGVDENDTMDQWEKMDEETRLFFVSMTRAKTKLKLYYTNEHITHGHSNRRPNKPSRFLESVLLSGHAVKVSYNEEQDESLEDRGGQTHKRQAENFSLAQIRQRRRAGRR